MHFKSEDDTPFFSLGSEQAKLEVGGEGDGEGRQVSVLLNRVRWP